MPGSVRLEESTHVSWLILSRPEKLNSLDTSTLTEATQLLDKACRASTALIAVTGEGRLFSAGIDLEEVAAARSPEEAARPFRGLRALLEAVLTCRKPVAAVLNGPAVAGGAELALAVDAAYAVEGAWLEWPEMRWGLIPPVLAALADSLGPGRGFNLLVSMERLPAREAAHHGLLAGVYPSLEEARRAVEALGERLAGVEPEALSAALDALRLPKRRALDLASRLEALAASMELVEKARRFLESRKR